MSQPWLITPSNTRVQPARIARQKFTKFKLSAETRSRDEVEYSVRRMTDAELEQYARRTTKRPALCFAFLVAAPFIAEGICRLLGAW